MKPLIATVTSMLFASASHAADWNNSPETLVRSFQADYLRWNNDALLLDEKYGVHGSAQHIERSYAKLLEKYCLPNFKGEPIAYGTRSSHDPSREEVIFVRTNPPNAIVRTRAKRTSTYSPIFEYEILESAGRWYLLQVYLVDGDERLPGL